MNLFELNLEQMLQDTFLLNQRQACEFLLQSYKRHRESTVMNLRVAENIQSDVWYGRNTEVTLNEAEESLDRWTAELKWWDQKIKTMRTRLGLVGPYEGNL